MEVGPRGLVSPDDGLRCIPAPCESSGEVRKGVNRAAEGGRAGTLAAVRQVPTRTRPFREREMSVGQRWIL
jgi:hypothetical protein